MKCFSPKHCSKCTKMPRKPCYWTRKLELELVEFVRQREFIWKSTGNTNHHIQQKYKAYAEFASKLGRGFTARSVRDRWVNIRSTFNHNLRRVEKSKATTRKSSEVYVPCWPLWKPLQFLRTAGRKDDEFDESFMTLPHEFKELSDVEVKLEFPQQHPEEQLTLRQRGQRTDRPRKRTKGKINKSKCKKVIDDLVKAMKPLVDSTSRGRQEQSYWFFGKHVTERLNCMREIDAECARRDIMKVLTEFSENSANDEYLSNEDDIAAVLKNAVTSDFLKSELGHIDSESG